MSNEQMAQSARGGLKTQHIIFIHEMAAHGIQRRAYMAAHPGCSAPAADRGAHRLMEKPEIREAIEIAGEKLMMEQYEIQKEELQRRLHRLETQEDLILKILAADFQKRVTGKDGIILSQTEDHNLWLKAMRWDRMLAKERAELKKEMRSLSGMPARQASPFIDEDVLHELNEGPGFFSEEEIWNSPDEPNPPSGPSEYYTVEEYCSIDDLTEEEKELLNESRAEQTANPEPDKTDQTMPKSSKNPDKTGQTGHEPPLSTARTGMQAKDLQQMRGAEGEGKFGCKSIYAALPPEERAELDEIRRRYMTAKVATDKVLYGEVTS